MRTSFFDAALLSDRGLQKKRRAFDVVFALKKDKVPGSFVFYEELPDKKRPFLSASLSLPVPIKWGQSFDVLSPGSEKTLASGKVLYPSAQKPTGKEAKKRIKILPQLLKTKIDMVSVLAREKGIFGLREEELLDFAPLSSKTLLPICQKLEAEGEIRILSFSPLFLLSQRSFEYLKEKITAFIQRYHEKHPNEPGVPKNEVRQKFDLPERVWFLALKHLFHEKKIRESEKRLLSIDFKMVLTPEEEDLLERLEEMCLEGKLHSVSMEDLQRRFKLSPRRLQNLLSLLAERRKIVQGEDGFILHSQWLEELVDKIRNLGEKELSVGQFKEMTGLSRKYAIPLLELLDQMGVTRRRGPTREIL